MERNTMNSSLWLFVYFIAMLRLVEANQKPNIVFILVDDLGWADVGFHGATQIATPNIDALAADGIILNKYYTQSLCTGTRVGLMTGVYPYRTALAKVLYHSQAKGLPLIFQTLPEHLKALGYDTHFVGTWGLGFYKIAFTPTRRGFDSAYGKWTGASDYWTHVATDDIRTYKQGFDFRHNDSLLWNATGIYSTTLFTNHAVNLIQRHDKSKPLFLLFSHQGVHTANFRGHVQSPGEYVMEFRHLKNRKRATFAGALTEVDISVGRVFEALYDNDMLNNTILVFSSSNGGKPVGEVTCNLSFNSPLRGTKGTYFEGGVRVPAFIWSRLLNSTRRVSKQMMHVTDWLPTLYVAAGGNKMNLGTAATLDAVDMWAALNDPVMPSPRYQIIHNMDLARHSFAITYKNHKGIFQEKEVPRFSGWYPVPGPQPRSQCYIYRATKGIAFKVLRKLHGRKFILSDPTKQGSILECPTIEGANPCNVTESPCLFDLDTDPCEQDNVADKNPKIVQTLTDIVAKGTSYVPWEGELIPDLDCDPGVFGGAWVSWRDPRYERYALRKRGFRKVFDTDYESG
ncbi:arylsulfatase B-like [Ornithodoros turicata]|uniref:arylsulfatase B-like n=1 Tax=Ornithodoros turicata TaxID=34597 RepID=UPI0031390CD7